MLFNCKLTSTAGTNYYDLNGEKPEYTEHMCEYCNNPYFVNKGAHQYTLNLKRHKHYFCSYTCRERWKKTNSDKINPTSLKEGKTLYE